MINLSRAPDPSNPRRLSIPTSFQISQARFTFIYISVPSVFEIIFGTSPLARTVSIPNKIHEMPHASLVIPPESFKIFAIKGKNQRWWDVVILLNQVVSGQMRYPATPILNLPVARKLRQSKYHKNKSSEIGTRTPARSTGFPLKSA
mmetsp:Transcript_60355/g.69957  ORF Transcript_60355/g.69957 Transcript_60355/m.69957 type:complete len:147 (-) Transcript_60355:72-512(-)